MVERGIPIDRLDQKWGGHEVRLDALLNHRVEDLGYSALCRIENLLDMVGESHTSAVSEAITEIAYFAGQHRVRLRT